jgi:hypothetical protein
MANIQLGNIDINFTNSKEADPANIDADGDLGTVANYASLTALRTRLAAISGTYYTTTRLDSMTINDMVFALRNHDDATTIASYMSNTTP